MPRTLVKGSDHVLCWTPRVSLPFLCRSFSETSRTNLTILPPKCGSQCFQYSALFTFRNDDKIHITKFATVTTCK